MVALFEIRLKSLFFDVEKKDNTVKLRQYLEIFRNSFVEERCFYDVLVLKQAADYPELAQFLVQLTIKGAKRSLVTTRQIYRSLHSIASTHYAWII